MTPFIIGTIYVFAPETEIPPRPDSLTLDLPKRVSRWTLSLKLRQGSEPKDSPLAQSHTQAI